MISLFFIEFIRVGGGERFRIDDSQSLDFIYDTASFSFYLHFGYFFVGFYLAVLLLMLLLPGKKWCQGLL